MNETDYKARYNIERNTTEIIILYKGSRVFSMEFCGQLQGAAVEEYVKEAIKILTEKGLIKSNTKNNKRRL